MSQYNPPELGGVPTSCLFVLGGWREGRTPHLWGQLLWAALSPAHRERSYGICGGKSVSLAGVGGWAAILELENLCFELSRPTPSSQCPPQTIRVSMAGTTSSSKAGGTPTTHLLTSLWAERGGITEEAQISTHKTTCWFLRVG